MSGLDGDVTRVELGRGPGRRRWWPFALAGVAAWVVAAVVLGGGPGAGDEEPVAEIDPTTSTATTERPTTSTTRRRPTTTTTTATSAVPGAPLLGRLTGWTLLVDDHRTVDLDTGVTNSDGRGVVQLATHHGVLVSTADGLLWRPFPFDEATVVPLDPEVLGAPTFPSGDDAVWVVQQDASAGRLQLVELHTGRIALDVELPIGAWVVGATERHLVIGAGGDTFVVDRGGEVRPFADASPIAVVGDGVLVTVCDESARCATHLDDLESGERREVPGLPANGWFSVWRSSVDGWALAESYDDSPRASLVLIGPDGATISLPPELPSEAHRYAWTPDGAHLLVGAGEDVLVVDPFADGGPAVVTSFVLRGTKDALVVLEAPAG